MKKTRVLAVCTGYTGSFQVGQQYELEIENNQIRDVYTGQLYYYYSLGEFFSVWEILQTLKTPITPFPIL